MLILVNNVLPLIIIIIMIITTIISYQSAGATQKRHETHKKMYKNKIMSGNKLTNSMEQSPSWGAVSQLVRNLPNFMEPEVRSPRSQEPVTCFYHKPDQSIPCSHPMSLRSTLVLSSHLRLGLPSRLSPSGFPTHLLSPIHATCVTYIIGFELVTGMLLVVECR